jgi:phosphoribosylaminoimidazole-succinocarboxamide synthase
MAQALRETRLPFPLLVKGKVRDVYDVGGNRLLIVATDRISAFDVVMAEPVPGKGMVLNQLTVWWLNRLGGVTPHHLITADPDAMEAALPALAAHRAVWERRAMLVRRAAPLPIECVVRGYIAGSAWAEYRERGTLAGEPLPAGLREADRLDPPIFSPATKAVSGHDENISFTAAGVRIGAAAAETVRARSFALYELGRDIAAEAGIIVADTKFEFGRLPDGEIVLIDEVLTPDSSRFWPAGSYEPGRPQPSLDKQPLRDYLDELVRRGEWDRQPPPPPLPGSVIESARARYRDIFRRLTGSEPERFSLRSESAHPSARS